MFPLLQLLVLQAAAAGGHVLWSLLHPGPGDLPERCVHWALWGPVGFVFTLGEAVQRGRPRHRWYLE